MSRLRSLQVRDSGDARLAGRLPAGVMAAFAALLTTLAVSPLGCRDSSPASTLDAASRRKVFLIGLDGADWKVVQPLLDEGKMPALARLIREGVRGELKTLVPALSPVVWTSIATGKSPDKHGITDFWREASESERTLSPEEQEHQERLRALGYIGTAPRERPMTLFRRTDRKQPALWNLLSDRGISCDVLAWWVTYPSETIKGVMVSDRFLYDRWALATRTRGIPYDTSGGLVSPPDAEARLRSHVLPLQAVTSKDLERLIHGAVTTHANLTLHDAEDELRIVYAKDESVVRIARALLEEKVPRLFAAYIEGTDIASHYFWKYRFTDDWNRRYPDEKVPVDEIARYGGVIDAYYQLQDRSLATLLRFADADTTIIVCSDHGFVTGKRPPGTPGAARTVSGVHEESGPPGILILSGSGIRRGAPLQGATVYDIAPTVLALLGLPAEPGMDGHVLDGVLAKPEAAH